MKNITDKVLKKIKENWNSETQTGYSQQAVNDTIRRIFIEIGKVIDEEISKEQECMKRDKYEEQEIEHINQIEMANKIKQKLGIK